MPTPNDLNEAIAENAAGPKRVQGDSGSVEQHSLADQVGAAKHLAADDATAKPHRGLRFTKLVMPGTSS